MIKQALVISAVITHLVPEFDESILDLSKKPLLQVMHVAAHSGLHLRNGVLALRRTLRSHLVGDKPAQPLPSALQHATAESVIGEELLCNLIT